MALNFVRKIDRIEVVFPPDGSAPVLQVRYLDAIINDKDGTVVAEKGYHREVFNSSDDPSEFPVEVQAALAAMMAFRQAHPDRKPTAIDLPIPEKIDSPFETKADTVK